MPPGAWVGLGDWLGPELYDSRNKQPLGAVTDWVSGAMVGPELKCPGFQASGASGELSVGQAL